MTGWLSRYRWTLLHSVRMTTAGTVAFASAYALGLPEALSAAVTAIVVTQSNLGGSLRTAVEQIIGSAFGAAYAIAVALAIRPADALASAAALAIALAPLAILTARSPGYRIAPITAAIVLLGTNGLQYSPLDLGAHRILGVALGCGVGLLVSILIVPARASRSVVETAARIVGLLAEQLQALAAGGANCQEVLASKARDTRESLVRLASFSSSASLLLSSCVAETPRARAGLDGKSAFRSARMNFQVVHHDYVSILAEGLRRGRLLGPVIRDDLPALLGHRLPSGLPRVADAARDGDLIRGGGRQAARDRRPYSSNAIPLDREVDRGRAEASTTLPAAPTVHASVCHPPGWTVRWASPLRFQKNMLYFDLIGK